MKKMKITYLMMTAFTMVALMMSCRKDGVIDGGLSIARVDMTTYDFLKTHPTKQFDTTILIIDKAGLKDLINSPGTFFVPNNYAIRNYLNAKRAEARDKDERLDFNLDSLFKKFTPQMLKDSMGMYFFPQKIVREDLNENGTTYQTSTPNVLLNVSLESSNDYQVDGIINNKPNYIYLTRILGDKDIYDDKKNRVDPSGDEDLIDRKVLCQTTGILTNTGVVHVLYNGHRWSFNN